MKKPLSEVRSGDVICADRGLYRHYGVYDHGKVIDVTLNNGNKSLQSNNARVNKRSLQSFLNGDPGFWETGYKHSKQIDDAFGSIGGLLGDILDLL